MEALLIKIFIKTLEMSLTAGYVILAVLLIRLLLKKAPKKYSYALWSVAAFRLICPVSFQAVFSLFSLRLGSRELGVPSEAVQGWVNTSAPLETVAPQTGGAAPTVNESLGGSLAQSVPTPGIGYSVDPIQVVLFVGSILWLIGMAVLLLYALISYWRLRRKLNTAILMEGNVFQSDKVRTPFILGFVKPKIYIPFGLQDSTLHYVLAHERTHLKRLDHLVKPLAFLLLVVHWFNPMVWLAFHLMGKDMEMSCDEAVLAKEENIRKEYSTTLLSLAANKRFPSPSPLAFGETGVKSRIKNALKWKRPRLWVTLGAAVLCIAAVAACAADPVEEEGVPQETVAFEFGPGAYVTYDIVFQNVLKSSFHPDGDNGKLYVKEERAFVIQSRTDGTSMERIEDVNWEWQSWEQAKDILEPLIDKTLDLDLSGYEEIFYQPLNEEVFLLKVDGSIWLVEVGGDMIWTIYSLVPQGYMGTALWQFKPQFSAYSPWFEFVLTGFGEMKLAVHSNDGRVELTENGFRWTPMDENGQVLMEDKITFSLSNPDGTTAWWGNLYLTGARLDDRSGYCYTAELTGTGLHLEDSWNMSGAVILPENTFIAPSDEEINANNGSFVVMELEPGATAVSENTITFTETGRVEYTFNYGSPGLDVELGLMGEDGTEILRHITGGSNKDALTDIPPGTYRLFFRNCSENLQYANTTELPLSVGVCVIHYLVIGGTLTAAQEEDWRQEIAALLEEICSSPAYSSAPGDYINAHPEEYQALVDMGDLTLCYLTEQFLIGGQTDLRSHIMRALLDDLTELQLRLYAETGQEYFDAWIDAAKEMADSMDTDRLTEEYPGVHLVVALAEEWEKRGAKESLTEEKATISEESFFTALMEKEQNSFANPMENAPTGYGGLNLYGAEEYDRIMRMLAVLFTVPDSRWEEAELAEMETELNGIGEEPAIDRTHAALELLEGFISESEVGFWVNFLDDLHGAAVDTYFISDDNTPGSARPVQQRLYTLTPVYLMAQTVEDEDLSLWNVTVTVEFQAETGTLAGEVLEVGLAGTVQMNEDGTISRLNLSKDSQDALKKLQESFAGCYFAG